MKKLQKQIDKFCESYQNGLLTNTEKLIIEHQIGLEIINRYSKTSKEYRILFNYLNYVAS
jgi:hypothetical protein